MLIMLLSAGLSQAQEPLTEGAYPQINTQAFRPSVDSQKFFWTNESRLTEDRTAFIRGVFSYTKDPFTYVDYLGNEISLLSDISTLDFIAGVAYNDFRVGLVLPFYFGAIGTTSNQTELDVVNGNEQDIGTGSVGFGDTTLDFKYRVLDERTRPIGAQVSVRSSLPTNTTELATGTDGVVYELEAGVDKTFGSALLAMNIGHRGIPTVEFEDSTWGSQIYTRIGGAISASDTTGAAIEYIGSGVYGGDSSTKPKELLLSGWKRVGEDGLNLRGGFGFGLNDAITAPKYRILFSVGLEPLDAKDSDGDGLLDNVDECINTPEDIDGVLDNDGCPEPTIVKVVVVNQFGEHVDNATWNNGTESGKSKETYEAFGSEDEITFTASAEGHTDTSVSTAIPDKELFKVKMELPMVLGQLTVKAVDTKGNPIKGATWSIVGQDIFTDMRAGRPADVKPGKWTIRASAEGYRRVERTVSVVKEKEEVVVFELVPSKAQLDGSKIDIKDKVFFESGSDVILNKSFSLLEEVSFILSDHPELTKIRIEGHTDNRGNDDMNMELSQRRANSVKQYLEKQGIEADRLEAVGFGETQPVATNDTAGGRAENRRVIFQVVERSDD